MREQRQEWTFCEDSVGIVYCLGRMSVFPLYEAVAVYEKVPEGTGTKQSLSDTSSYNRIMYHGFPEESKRLALLQPSTQSQLLGNLSLKDQCMYIDPRKMKTADQQYASIDTWMNSTDTRMDNYKKSLEIACHITEKAGLSLAGATLYGGAAYGLVGKVDKRVDDIDLLLNISSEALYEGAKSLQTGYDWAEIDPSSVLSARRRLLKAKRWSTSQIRLFTPDFLSIDLKIARPNTTESLWNALPESFESTPVEEEFKVVSDDETFCISPAIQCEDRHGNLRTILLRGYPYIGCAIKGDIINIKGRAVENTPIILVTQGATDRLIPDFNNVPIH